MEQQNGGGGETAGLRFPNLRKILLFAAAAGVLSVVVFLFRKDISEILPVSSQAMMLGTWDGFVVSFLFGFPLLYLILLAVMAVREGMAFFKPSLPKLALAIVLFFLTPLGNLGFFPFNLAFVLFYPGFGPVGDWSAMLKFFLDFSTRPIGLTVLAVAYCMSCVALSGNVTNAGAIRRAAIYLWVAYAGLTLFTGIAYI